MAITISIQDDTWKMLNDRKNPGETFDSVIKKALITISKKIETGAAYSTLMESESCHEARTDSAAYPNQKETKEEKDDDVNPEYY